MDRSRRARVLTIAKVALAAGIVVFILWKKVDLGQLLSHFRTINRTGILGCWCAYGLLFSMTAWRWRMLFSVQGIRVKYFAALEYQFISLFFNNIMLGSMGGDVMKAYYLAQAAPRLREAAVVSVLSDRLAGFLSFFGIGFVGIIVNMRDERLRPASWLFLAFFLAMLGGLFIVYSKPVLKRIPFLGRALGKLPFEQNLRRLYESFYAYRLHGAALARVLLLSSSMQLGFVLIYYVIARMLGMTEVSVGQLLLLIPVISTIFAIPVTPSGWGTGEYAFCRLFATLGVPADRALALDLAFRGMSISWGLLGGILYVLPRWRIPAGALEREQG